MGIGSATGENRTVEATKKAISSPLLEVAIDGAKQVLLNITGGPDLSLFEAQDASEIVTQAATNDVNIIFGTSINEELGDEVVVTVIATGLDSEGPAMTRATGRHTGEATAAPEVDAAPQHQSRDPFTDWDMRREPSPRGQREQAPTRSNFDNVKKTEFDVFESQPNTSAQNDDDQPPFFKRRRNN